MPKKTKMTLFLLISIFSGFSFLYIIIKYKMSNFSRHLEILFSDFIPLTLLFMSILFSVIFILFTDPHWKNKNPSIMAVISYTNNFRVIYLELSVVAVLFGLVFFNWKIFTIIIALLFTLWMPLFKWYNDGSLFYNSSNYKKDRPPYKKRVLNHRKSK